MKKVVVMGMGYIGLPTAVLIARKGISVLGVDTNPGVVRSINDSILRTHEPDLDGLFDYVLKKGYLKAGNKPDMGDAYIIAVPTPVKINKKPDISYVRSAVQMILPCLKKGALILLESTCPVGTTERVAKAMFSQRPELRGNIYVAYCPERVLPGRIIYELENNDRIIGGIDDESTKKAADFYSLFVKGNLYGTNSKTAEMCKLAENAYRDVNIAFANELSIICDKAGIDTWNMIDLANKHPRVKILSPGAGVGGHCIAIDPWFIIHGFKNKARLMHTARKVNNHKKGWVIQKIENSISAFKAKNRRPPLVAIMGLTYKQDVNDLRESPALCIARTLNRRFNVITAEPNVVRVKGLENLDYRSAVKKADIIVFLVMHREFKDLKIGQDRDVLYFCHK